MKWRRRISAILIISVFCLLSISNYAAADAIDDMVAQMQEIYGFMDEHDKDHISTADQVQYYV